MGESPYSVQCPTCKKWYTRTVGPEPDVCDCCELREELNHAHEAFTRAGNRLDREHCTWCYRSWLANRGCRGA